MLNKGIVPEGWAGIFFSQKKGSGKPKHIYDLFEVFEEVEDGRTLLGELFSPIPLRGSTPSSHIWVSALYQARLLLRQSANGRIT